MHRSYGPLTSSMQQLCTIATYDVRSAACPGRFFTGIQPMEAAMLELIDVTKRYGDNTVLDRISLTVDEGSIVSILGPSGGGKTTLLNVLLGITEVTSGRIVYDGEDITRVAMEKRGFNIVFQDYALFPNLSAYENIVYGLRNDPRVSTREEVDELIELLGLQEHLGKRIDQLSGGQKQRVALARTLVTKPRLLLLDEPLSALDGVIKESIKQKIKQIVDQYGLTTIMVTHDPEEALTMSDTIVVMNQGYIQQMGSPEQIYNEPENAFVADFIGESNILDGIMLHDGLVEIAGAKFACVDKGFGCKTPVDVVIRPEDIDLVKPEEGTLQGVVTHLIFKGVHYEMEVTTPDGWEWLVHSTDLFPVGEKVGIHVDPFDIQIMNKPASEDEEAVGIDE